MENREISARNYYDVAVEPNGTFWLATSDGLFRYAQFTWQSPASVRQTSLAVHGCAQDAEGRLWFVSSRGLYAVENESTREHPFPQGADRLTAGVNALLPLRDGTFLVNTGETPLQFDPRTGEFRAVSNGPRGQRLRPLGLLPDGSVCLLSSLPKTWSPPLRSTKMFPVSEAVSRFLLNVATTGFPNSRTDVTFGVGMLNPVIQVAGLRMLMGFPREIYAAELFAEGLDLRTVTVIKNERPMRIAKVLTGEERLPQNSNRLILRGDENINGPAGQRGQGLAGLRFPDREEKKNVLTAPKSSALKSAHEKKSDRGLNVSVYRQ